MWEDQQDASRALKKAVTDKGLIEAAREPLWGQWFCLSEYRRQTTKDSVRFIRAPIAVWKERDLAKDTYQPLVKCPDLFLQFARLAEYGSLDGGWDIWLQTDTNARVAQDWAYSYGVLGLTPSDEPRAWWGDARGGVEDSVRAFAREAWTANRVLGLYDATHGSEGIEEDSIRKLLPEEFFYFSSRGSLDRQQLYRVAMFYIGREIQARVARYVYPCMYWREKEGRYDEYYDFSNLCGALWLQAMWLLTTDEVRRCRNPACNRIIDYKQPEKPLEQIKGQRKEYKRRKDIKYCPEDTGRFCRVYHHRERGKLRRMAATIESGVARDQLV